jgi:hypothetical protein
MVKEEAGRSHSKEGHTHHASTNVATPSERQAHSRHYGVDHVDQRSKALGSKGSVAGKVFWEGEVSGGLSSFWAVEVRPLGVQTSNQGPPCQRRHGKIAEIKEVRNLPSSKGQPRRHQPGPNCTLHQEGCNPVPRAPLLPPPDRRHHTTCGGAGKKRSTQIHPGLHDGPAAHHATAARIRALELLIANDIVGEEGNLPHIPWKVRYYNGEVKVETGTSPGAPRQRCTAPLAPISTSIINTDALLRWAHFDNDTKLLRALSYLTEEGPMPFTLPDQPAAAAPSSVSRGFSASDVDIINTISEPCHQRRHFPLPLFKVPKKGGLARLVQDGRPLNSRIERPPPMGLPDLDSIIARATTHTHMAQADAVSFFYQLPLALRLRDAFSFNIGVKRGAFTTRRLNRLPMGFSHAPFVAQTVATAICRYAKWLLGDEDVSIVPWIDNFIIQAKTASGRNKAKTALSEAFRFFSVNVTWGSSNEILGLVFSPAGVKLARDFVEKALSALRPSATTTGRRWATTMGCVIWATITTIRSPLSGCYPMLLLLQQTATAEPDTTFDISPKVADAMRHWRTLLRRNLSFRPEQVSGQVDALWTDASTTTGAAMLVQERQALFHYINFGTDIPIYYKELLAALMGCDMSSKTKRILLTDNQPLAYALAKGHSTKGGPTTNKIVADILRRISGVGWVPTHEQIADAMTRSPRTIPQPHLLPSTKIPLYQSYFLSGGRGAKEREGGPIYSYDNKLQQPKSFSVFCS